MNWKKKKDNPEAQAPEAAAAGKGPAAFWKKNWKLLVPAVCVIVAGGAFLLWPNPPAWTPAIRRRPRSTGTFPTP